MKKTSLKNLTKTAFITAFSLMAGCSTFSAQLPPSSPTEMTVEQLLNAPPSLPQLNRRLLDFCTEIGNNFAENAILSNNSDMEKSSWSVLLGAVPLPLNQHHLYIKLVQNNPQKDYIRIDGIASPLEVLNDKGNYRLEYRPSAYGLSPNNKLLGIMTPPDPHVCKTTWNDDNDSTRGKFIEVHRGDINSAIDFLAIASQFTIANNSVQQPYALLGTNSNAFAYSLLVHFMGKKFNQQEIESAMQRNGWNTPGFGNMLLADAIFTHYERKPGETIAEAQTRIFDLNGKENPGTQLVCNPKDDIKKEGYNLHTIISAPLILLSTWTTIATNLPRPAYMLSTCTLSETVPVTQINNNPENNDMKSAHIKLHPKADNTTTDNKIQGLNGLPARPASEATPSRSSQARPPYRSRQARYAPRAYASQGL